MWRPCVACVRSDGSDESKAASNVDTTVDRSVVMYNQAVALYHMRQFHAAQQVLDGLVGTVLTPVDEQLAMRASFLLLDIYASGYRGCIGADQVRVARTALPTCCMCLVAGHLQPALT